MSIDLIDIKTCSLSAVIAWGIVEALKPALTLAGFAEKGPRYALAVRLAALAVGAVVGLGIHPALDGKGGALTGAAIGAAAGALNALIVAQVKARLRRAGEGAGASGGAGEGASAGAGESAEEGGRDEQPR